MLLADFQPKYLARQMKRRDGRHPAACSNAPRPPLAHTDIIPFAFSEYFDIVRIGDASTHQPQHAGDLTDAVCPVREGPEGRGATLEAIAARISMAYSPPEDVDDTAIRTAPRQRNSDKAHKG